MGSTSKPNDSTTYTGVVNPDPTQMGTLACGGWDGGLPAGGNQQEVFQGVPANVRVQLSGVSKIGPNQYSTTLSLSGTNTLQLVPNGADAQQTPTSAVAPNSFSWTYLSRNINVCRVNSSGRVTAVGRGQCEILVSNPRQVNASFTTATPSGTEGVQASLLVTVLA